MVTVAYNAYCAISMEGDDDTYDGKTAGSRSWEVETTVNSLVETLFHVIITRMGTDLIFLSRLGSTICFTNFGSHDPIVLYWNPWYTEPCYKGSLLYCGRYRADTILSRHTGRQMDKVTPVYPLQLHWSWCIMCQFQCDCLGVDVQSVGMVAIFFMIRKTWGVHCSSEHATTVSTHQRTAVWVQKVTPSNWGDWNEI